MDAVYSKALKRKQEIESELAKINLFLDMYHAFEGSNAERNEPTRQESSIAEIGDTPAQRASRFPRPSEIADMAERLIRELGRPLTRAEIVSRLEDVGVDLNSEDKPRYVGTILWREKDRFVNIPGEGYTMLDMATPLQNFDDLLGDHDTNSGDKD